MEKFQTPKGTRDFPPEEMGVRRNVISVIEKAFLRHQFLAWDGPAFEYMSTLSTKCGEGVSEEIYSFTDKGKRELGLRFELTTTIARIVANNPQLKKPLKVFSIGKVWRYERPQMGRYREFLQADADIFGSSEMSCECELVMVAKTVLEELGFEDFKIYLNNRKILRAQMVVANIPEDKRPAALRALDKISKIGADGVKKEFLENGLTEKHFEVLTKSVAEIGDNTVALNKIEKALGNDPLAIKGISELREILTILGKTQVADSIVIDSSLVRGLDYYTGPIFEARIGSGEEVGSVVGGGRYDGLVETFGGQPTSAVGFSFGIERLIDLVNKDPKKRAKFEQAGPLVQIVYFQKEMLPEVLRVATKLRDQRISVDYDLSGRAFKKQLQQANNAKACYALIIGEEELLRGKYQLKDLKQGEQTELTIEEICKKICP